MTPAAFAIILGAWAPIVSAQGGPGALVSAVAPVRLVAVVLPRVTPTAPTRAARITWVAGTGMGVASIALSSNTPYRIVVRRIEQGDSASVSRIWIRGDDRQLHELRNREPVVILRGQCGDGSVLVPFRLPPTGKGTPAGDPPLRFDVLVEPTL
ncbi:MAG TPA: hypothetical protein VI297_00305 [Gemmatimonadales bacterium]